MREGRRRDLRGFGSTAGPQRGKNGRRRYGLRGNDGTSPDSFCEPESSSPRRPRGGNLSILPRPPRTVPLILLLLACCAVPSGSFSPAATRRRFPEQHRPPLFSGRRSSSHLPSSSSCCSGIDRIRGSGGAGTLRMAAVGGGGGGWEEIVFNAQSAASQLAGVGLDDPSNLIASLPIMYGAGLLTSVSPCVWGLLPLTVSYISSAAGEREDRRTTLPTLAFAAGLAVVFCSLGIAAAQLGGIFGGSSTTTAILPVVSYGICLAMGLQLLDLVRIPLPSFDAITRSAGGGNGGDKEELIILDESGRVLETTTASSSSPSGNSERGSLLRTFLLGGSSALVASPCATPVLTSILAYVASAQNPALGALLLFGYTVGYSTPLLIVAGTGGQALVNIRRGQPGDDGDGGGGADMYSALAPWVTPFTAGILLWYGTDGMLTALFGDPSLAGLTILE